MRTQVVVCDDGHQFEFDIEHELRIVDGRVEFEPSEGVLATLEFPSRVVAVEEGALR